MPDCASRPTASLLNGLSRRIEAQTGLAFPPSKWRDLNRALDRITEEAGFEDAGGCATWLLEGAWDKDKSDLCARHLTIPETYFFREPRAFDLLCDYARRKLARDGDATRLRIWSAGCCTGEEAYSIAMALLQAIPELPPEAVRILATDFNPDNLRHAQAGVYRQWSFRRMPAQMRERHFTPLEGNVLRIRDAARKLVRFAELNLATSSFPSPVNDTQAMDVIFCRNVLMYFSRPQAQAVIGRFRQCLIDGGWLLVSPGEASAELFSGFSGVYYPDAIHFRKAEARALPVSAAPPLSVTGSLDTTRPVSAPHAPRKPAPIVRIATAPAADAGPYRAQALASIESGDWHAALDNLKRAAYLEPDCILSHYLMGIVLAAQSRPREAARRFHTACELLAALDGTTLVPGTEGMSAACLAESVQDYLDRVRQ